MVPAKLVSKLTGGGEGLELRSLGVLLAIFLLCLAWAQRIGGPSRRAAATAFWAFK